MYMKTLEKHPPEKNGVKVDFSLWDILKFGWGIILPHNWYLHKKSDRLQEAQSEYVRRKEFDDTISSLREKIDNGHRDLTNRFDENRRELTERFDRLLNHMLEKK